MVLRSIALSLAACAAIMPAGTRPPCPLPDAAPPAGRRCGTAADPRMPSARGLAALLLTAILATAARRGRPPVMLAALS